MLDGLPLLAPESAVDVHIGAVRYQSGICTVVAGWAELSSMVILIRGKFTVDYISGEKYVTETSYGGMDSHYQLPLWVPAHAIICPLADSKVPRFLFLLHFAKLVQ